jgi:hypothetical protein
VALRVVKEADESWAASQIATGLSSGEGLIHAVRDPVVNVTGNGEREIVDPGASDKRLLVCETEFSGALKQFSRQGNTLSNVLRDAWDSPRVLRTLTRNAALCATGAHISLIGHSTTEDLLAHLGQLEVANGLANRFLFVYAERSRLLPIPGRACAAEVDGLVADVRRALLAARGREILRWDRSADALWRSIYPELSADTPGVLGSLLARAEAHVLRLTALYTLLEQAPYMNTNALSAALGLWSYCARSAKVVYGTRTGNKAADRILAELPPGEVWPLNTIRERAFSKHIDSADLEAALELLAELGEVAVERQETRGRPATLIRRRLKSELQEKE